MFFERASDTPLVTISVLARGGAASDPVGAEGTGHHIAELAVRGAGALDRLGIDTELDRVGTSLSVNTSRDHLGYVVMCLARHADRVVELLATILSEPRFDAAEHAKLVRETRSDLEEIRDDDADLAARYFSRFFAPGHPYARAIEGSEESLQTIAAQPASELKARYRDAVSPDRLVLGFAGCLEEGEAVRYAETLAGGDNAPAAPIVDTSNTAEPPSGSRVFLIEKPNRSQSQVLIGHRAPRYGDADGPALLLAEAAFGGMFSSRLMQEVRVKRGWSYDTGIHLARAAQPSWIRMSLAPSTDVSRDAIELVIDEYRRLIQDGISEHELDLARRFTIGGMLLSRATARQRIQQSCIGAINQLPSDFVETLPERLQNLDRNAVNAAITRHLSPDALTIIVVGDANLGATLTDFGPVTTVPYRDY